MYEYTLKGNTTYVQYVHHFLRISQVFDIATVMDSRFLRSYELFGVLVVLWLYGFTVAIHHTESTNAV